MKISLAVLISLFLAATTQAQEPLAYAGEYVVRTRILTANAKLPAVTALMRTNTIAGRTPSSRKLVKAKIMGDYCPWAVGTTSCSINYFYKVAIPASKPKISSQTIPWGVGLFPGVAAIKVWPQFQGAGNIVVVMDTGIDLTHPDLVDNLWINDKEQVDGIDNDGNGCIDDINGCNFAGTGVPQDRNGHGTHVAGTIGAAANTFGVQGVAPGVRIIAVKILGDSGGGSVYSIVKGIDYVTALKRSGVNIVAINASFGSTGYSKPMQDAIEDAGRAGILFVAAAGNNGTNNDNLPFYPAGYELESIISVGAIDKYGSLASFTNWGIKSVHLFAPGVSIYSTYAGGLYTNLSGTSMAAPHIAGISALLPGTVSERREKILKGVVQRDNYTQKSITGGTADAFKAFNGESASACKKIRCKKCKTTCRKKCRGRCRASFDCKLGECKK